VQIPEDIALLDIELRQFTQERAQRTYLALIEAAGRVFLEQGFDQTQTPDIAARAQVSVGTFYRYFKDKREVFLEIVRRHLARAHREVLARLGQVRLDLDDRRSAIGEVVEILLTAVERDAAAHRLFLEMSLRDPEVAALRQAFDVEGRRRLTEVIAAACPPPRVVDAEAMAYILHTSVVECAMHMAGARGPSPVSRERGRAALVDVISRALFGIEDPP
jgi:AcrR family transcriptional regulator